MAKKRAHFTAIHECIDKTYPMANLVHIVDELEQLTQIIWQNLPQVADLCYCGALDYQTQTLVIYVKDPASTYKINNLMPIINEVLAESDKYFAKVLLRNKISTQKLNKPIKTISTDQRNQLSRLAIAINREDLIQQSPSSLTPQIDGDWLKF